MNLQATAAFCIPYGFVATVSLQEMGFLIFSQNSILFVSNKRVIF
jgi:hypothetical protein